DPEADRVAHGWVGEQHALDLVRGDVLAASKDHLLDPALQAQVAVLEDPAVAGAKPALAEVLGVRSGIVEIARRDAGAADHDLPDISFREVGSALVDGADLGARRDAHRPGHAPAR